MSTRKTVARFILANGIGMTLVIALARKVSSTMPFAPSTDIIGYPVHHAFNINDIYIRYYIALALFPLVAYLVFKALPVAASGLVGLLGMVPADRSRAVYGAARSRGAALVRQAAVGLVLSFAFVGQTAIPLSKSFYLQRVVLTAAYLALLHGTAWAVRRLRRNDAGVWDSLSLVNASCMPFTVLPIWIASRSTRIIDPHSGGSTAYPWMHPALTGAIVVGLILWAVVGLRRAKAAGRLDEWEASFFFCVPLAVVVFLLHSYTLGLTGLDLFHDGETLASARLMERGLFPWRDVLFIHGLLEDPFKSWIGMKIVQDTAWGALAASNLFLFPLYWVFFYWMALGLFWRRRVYVLFLAFLLPQALPALFGQVHFRFALNSLVVLTFCALLRDPGRLLKAWLFSALLLAQAIVTPESLFNLPAFGLALIARDAYEWDWQRTWRDNLRLSLRVATGGAAMLAVWMAYLASHGALRDYVFSFINFSSDYRFTGGIPLQWNRLAIIDTYRVVLFAPWVMVWVTFWRFAVGRWRSTRLEPLDWTMLALTIFVTLYYQKGITRPDIHIYHPFIVAYPLMFIQFYYLIDWLESQSDRNKVGQWIHSAITHQPVYWGLAVLGFAANPTYLSGTLSALPTRYQQTAERNPVWQRAGYVGFPDETNDSGQALKRFLEAHLDPNDKVFDFTNNPALFFFLLDRLPATRFFHISMAMHREAQAMVIDEMERDRPKVVVYYGTGQLTSWDGVPNMVRHYDVSQYLLDHYEPFAIERGFGILKRRGIEIGSDESASVRAPAGMDTFLMGSAPCDWGFAPAFWTTHLHATASSAAEDLRFTSRFNGATTLIEVGLPERFNGTHYLDLRFRKVGAHSFTMTDRPTVSASQGATEASRAEYREIRFNSVAGTDVRYRIQVGSCPQWLAYQDAPSPRLYITANGPVEVDAVELRR